MLQQSTPKYLLIVNIDDPKPVTDKKEIDFCMRYIQKKKKEIKFESFEPQDHVGLSEAAKFGFILTTCCDDDKYQSIFERSEYKIKDKNRVIRAIDTNFNNIYEKIYSNLFSNICLTINSVTSLDLSNLAKKVCIPINFNSFTFAQTLYFLIYYYHARTKPIDEINLDNNDIDDNGLIFFNDYLNRILHFKKIFIRKNKFNISNAEKMVLFDSEYFFYEDYVYLISRQTDLSIRTIVKFIEDKDLHDAKMSLIINEIQKFEHNFQQSDYDYKELYDLHQLRYIK